MKRLRSDRKRRLSSGLLPVHVVGATLAIMCGLCQSGVGDTGIVANSDVGGGAYSAACSGRFNASNSNTWNRGLNVYPAQSGDVATINAYTVNTLLEGEVAAGVTVNVSGSGTLRCANSGATVTNAIHTGAVVNVDAGGTLQVEQNNMLNGPITLNGGRLYTASGTESLTLISGPLTVVQDSVVQLCNRSRVSPVGHGAGKITVTGANVDGRSNFGMQTNSDWTGDLDLAYTGSVRGVSGLALAKTIPANLRLGAGAAFSHYSFSTAGWNGLPGVVSGNGTLTGLQNHTWEIGGTGTMSPGEAGVNGGVGTLKQMATSNYNATIRFRSGATYVADIAGTGSGQCDTLKMNVSGTGTGKVEILAGASLVVNLCQPLAGVTLDAAIIDCPSGALGSISGQFSTVTWNNTNGWQNLAVTKIDNDLHVQGQFVSDNSAPTADPQSVTTVEDSALAITLTGSDPDGDPLSYVVVAGPADGTLSGTAPNLTYTPAAKYYGSDAFTFKVNDGKVDSAPAEVSITVAGVNDVPTANGQSIITAEDTPKAITLTGSDVEGSPLTYAVASDPAHGVLSGTAPNLTYTPAANFSGVDSFTFTVNDGTVDSAPAPVWIRVGPAPAQVPAFPGAEGFGTGTTHARGKQVFHVTRLDDLDMSQSTSYFINAGKAGCFRWALAAAGEAGGGYIVFDVAGVIQLVRTALVPANTYVAGQSAPGSGVAIQGQSVIVAGANVLIRNLRHRGNLPAGLDGMLIQEPATNVVLDHVSVSFFRDGAVDLVTTKDVTLQWCHFGDAVYSGTYEQYHCEPHLLRTGTDRISLHHNYYTHGHSRMPLVQSTSATNGLFEFSNNVIYDYRKYPSDFSGPKGKANAVGNLYVPGRFTHGSTTALRPAMLGSGGFTLHVSDNLALDSFPDCPGHDDAGCPGTDQDVCRGNDVPVIGSRPSSFLPETDIMGIGMNQLGPVPGVLEYSPTRISAIPAISYQSINESVDDVISIFGALPRDNTDARLANELLTHTGGWKLDMPADNNVYAGTPQTDADQDGMPDTWEQARGGNLAPNARNLHPDYDNIEVYLNGAMDLLIGNAITIDAWAQLMGGANNAPVANALSVTTAEDTAKAITLTGSDIDGNPLTYAVVTGPAHGTLSGTAPHLTYTPAANYSGPDSFTFKVNDGFVDSTGATVSITVTVDSGDSNTNGIPDAWELQVFANLTNSATGDNDGDGLNNYGEWVAGTDPTNGNSVVRFTDLVQNVGAGMILRWPSESNRFYTLRLSTNLMLDPFNTVLTNRVPANPPMNVHTDAVHRPGAAFYRISVETP